MLRLAITNDADLAPLFFPLAAGWVDVPSEIELVAGTTAEGVERLLQAKVDVALVDPITYAANQAQLLMLPTPVRAPDMATDAIFLISHKRLDKFERPRVAVSAVTSATGAALFRLIANSYYGFDPDIRAVESDTAALRAMQGQVDICILSGEVAMRAAGPANSKGYVVEDLTRAWWIMTGQPLPIGVLAVRRAWIEANPEANSLVRGLMLTLRSAVQKGKDQAVTIADREEKRTGLPASALMEHYNRQKYELNESHLRSLLEFYRRAATLNLVPANLSLEFFPAASAVAAAPSAPPRRSQPEAAPARRPDPISKDSSPKPKPPRATDRAQAKGLRVIKGGKDSAGEAEPTDEAVSDEDLPN